ncbi:MULTISPECIES: serine/threonine-protein kinase [Paenibacillus]|uniref:serine/threonine-protein kinase n=2 Tax=Paenibacillus TaxID=44249 RepID=UPI0009D6EA9F|nr:serine/threonine-protein kinase [Paenibacillus odorifer]
MNFASKLGVGQIMDARYRIIDQIGTGGMSIVYLAEDLRLKGKRWAVKESVSSATLHSDIEAEAEMLMGLDHPRLPRIVDYYLSDKEGYSYLVMDYIEGITLSQLMRDNPGPLPCEFILQIAKQLLEVLQYLHGHHPPIVYRDLKPSNLMLTKQKELMLIDFGIARNFRKGIAEDTVKLGTVGFAAPEQYGNGQSQPVSDLYGLGALLLYMATGGLCSHWESGMENKLRDQVPAAFIPIIRRLLRPHPEERYQEATAVIQALVHVEADMDEGNHSAVSVPLAVDKRKAKVIALLGVGPGLGTTHTSFAISSYLAQIGSTAWVDLSPDSSVYDRMHNLLDVQSASVPAESSESVFSWRKVHYWKRPHHGDVAELMRGAYQFVVLDLGTGGFDGALEEIKHSDIPILIASGADWRLEETLLWIRRKGLQPERDWRVGLPLAEQQSVELLRNSLGIDRVYNLPCQQDPFLQKGKLADVIAELLGDIKGERNDGKRRGFFLR